MFLTGSGLCARSWNVVGMITFRGLQGIGAGAIMATANTLAGVPARDRSRDQGRECLAQLLDYGSDLLGMTVEDFETRVAQRYFTGPASPASSTGPSKPGS
jgi:hypothetical protein